MRSLCYENIFLSHSKNTRFNLKGFALARILKARDFATRKWPITLAFLLTQPMTQLTIMFTPGY